MALEKGDGCIVRLVAMLDPSGEFRIETGDGGLMEVSRLADAEPYEAPEALRHARRCACRASTRATAENFWVGLSHFLPGGGAEMDATPIEKVYVVVDGEVTVIDRRRRDDARPARLVPSRAGRGALRS